ncbi:MAG TPA: hypothetical protein VFY17_10785 [Pilimelia sp.]|nr:hypothetical protein [Pilimelia sp.]
MTHLPSPRPPANGPLWRSVVALGAALLVALPTAPAAATVSHLPMAATPQFNGTVRTAVYLRGTVYVGGDFTAVEDAGRTHRRARLAAVDAATGRLTPWNPGADGRVRALTTDGTRIFAGGSFSAVAGVPRARLAALDPGSGAAAPAFRPRVSGVPYALAVGYGRLYVGGTLAAVDGRPRGRLAAVDPATGALDARWAPQADALVYSVAVGGGRVYLGGSFRRVNGAGGTLRLAAVHPQTGAVDARFRSVATYPAFRVTAHGSTLYAAHGGPGGHIAGYGADGRMTWRLTTDGNAEAVTVADGVLHFGGHFDNVCRSHRVNSVNGDCMDGAYRRVKLGAATLRGVLTDWAPQGNGIIGVHTIAAATGYQRLAVGGAFTQVNGREHRRFAQFP